LRADARFAHRSGAKVGVRVQEPLQICLEGRSKAKSVTTVPAVALAKAGQLTHIVRVSKRIIF